MRITHVSVGALPAVWAGTGGAVQRRVGELALAQAALGHEVTVLSPDVTSRDDLRGGVRVEYLGCRSRGPALHGEFLARARRTVAHSPRPDVLHVHNEPEGAVLLAGFRAPVVLSYDFFRFRRRLGEVLHGPYRRALLRHSLLLPVSRYCAEVSGAHWRLPPDRVRVLPNGVNVEQFAPLPEAARRERARLGIGDGTLVVYLGRICRQKGTHVLLDAHGRQREAMDRPPQLVLAGPVGEFGGGERDEHGWQAAIAHAGATYLGVVAEERLAGLLSAADVFVMPTLELEMQGMAALEAQACGTPVVATDHGGLPETVPSTCGVRVAPGDATALAGAVAALIDDPARRTALGRRAREHAAGYAWSRIARRSLALYEEVAG